MEAPSVNGAYLDRTRYPHWRVALCVADRVFPGSDLKLRQDGRHMMVDGALGQEQPLRDLGIRQVLGHQVENFELARGESVRITPRCWARGHAGSC